MNFREKDVPTRCFLGCSKITNLYELTLRKLITIKKKNQENEWKKMKKRSRLLLIGLKRFLRFHL